eukprot:6377344-Pyramimonas_sp.AAC.1
MGRAYSAPEGEYSRARPMGRAYSAPKGTWSGCFAATMSLNGFEEMVGIIWMMPAVWAALVTATSPSG